MPCNRDECKHWSNCDSVSQQHCARSWKNLVRLWRAQQLCDVIIIVEGQRFPCHAVVPAATSAFFRKAFARRNHMSVAEAPLSEKEVIVDFMKKEAFAEILHFMYTSELNIETLKIRPLILAAAKLEMQGMMSAIMRTVLDAEMGKGGKGLSINQAQKGFTKKKKGPRAACKGLGDSSDSDSAEDFMNGKPLTILGLLEEIRHQGDLGTLKKAVTFVARNFSKIVKTPGYVNASVHTIAALLDDDRLNMEELLVFKALAKWLEARQMHLVHGPYLLSKVRLQLLTPEELAEHVESKDYLMRKKKSRFLILEAFRYHCLKKMAETEGLDHPLPQGQKQRIGVSQPHNADMDEWTDEEDEQYLRKGTSERCPNPVLPCSCCPNYILASGGIDTMSKAPCDGVYKYEERENNWSRFARLMQPRNHHAVVYCKGCLYVIGGSDPSLTGPGTEVCPIAGCYKLGLESLKWTKIEAMSTPRMSLQAAYLDGYIYAMGGQDHKQRILRDIERYSLSGGHWEYAGALTSVRAGISVAVHKEKIWVAGGYCHKTGSVESTVEIFNERLGNWDEAGPLRFPRCFANLVECLTHLYIIGGAWIDDEIECGNFNSVYDVDSYNDEAKLWEGVTAMRVGRHDAGCAVLGPRIYIVGGKHCDDGAIVNLDSVECYSVESQDWIDGVTPLPIPLLGPGITYTK